MNPQPAHNEATNEEIATAITNPCSCHEAYKDRGLTDPSCHFHDMHYMIVEALQAKDAHAKALEEKLQDYKDTYDPVKSGLRADEVHCACAYELRATIAKLQPIVEKASMIKHIHRMEDPCTVVCSLADEAKDALSGCAGK